MYQPYPGEAQMPGTRRPPAPASVRSAVGVMYGGAAVSLIRVVVDVATKSGLKADIEKNGSHGPIPLTASQVNSAVTASIVMAVILGLIGVGLWILVARGSQNGQSWARITGSVLFGLDTLALLAGPLGLAVTGPQPAVAKLFTALVWLAGLGAVVLLWQRSSRVFFRGSPS
jgi:hypothetical protein